MPRWRFGALLGMTLLCVAEAARAQESPMAVSGGASAELIALPGGRA